VAVSEGSFLSCHQNSCDLQCVSWILAPYFMAPEVFQEKYGVKADIWSVACVAVQMATGDPPWKSLRLTSAVTLFQHIVSTTNAPDMTIEESHPHELTFRRLLDRCFQRRPEDRPSASLLLSDIFFVTEHNLSLGDSSECRGLFSPESTGSSYGTSPGGANLSPMRLPTRRRNSIGSASRSNCSPPIPRSSKKTIARSPLLSPSRDVADWPSWALKQLHGAGRGNSEIVQTPQSIDSLVYSESDNEFDSASPIGLTFIDTMSQRPGDYFDR
jgi:serine/threonine protein kinase